MRDAETGYRRQATGDRLWAKLRKGSDIADRLMTLSVAAVRLSSDLPRNFSGRHVAGQLIRAASGGGSNYEEARAAESRGDFVHKVLIAAKECRETAFWLELIQRCGWIKKDLTPGIQEASQLAAILSASARTARRNSPD